MDGEDQVANEFGLLEMVVKKLAVVARLKAPHQSEDADEKNAMGYLEGMGVEEHTPVANAPVLQRAHNIRKSVELQGFTDCGVSADVVYSWDFCPLDMSKEHRINLSICLGTMHPGCSHWVSENIPRAKLDCFMAMVEDQYLANPYHSHEHAVDVMHGCFRVLALSLQNV